MDVSKISSGSNAPWDVNVVIEVPMGVSPIKYEMDEDSGAVFVDRFLHTAMYYPCNYGFIPHSLSGDGDPADVLVVSPWPVVPGAVVRVRPVGVLLMQDESGEDEKIIAVPVNKLLPIYEKVKNYTDLPQLLLDQIAHFFEHYKDLEKNKWVKVTGWKDADTAASMISEALNRANAKAA